ncbi:MAG: D-aminoacyl-tRNA deacylase [Bacilli bacterium]
MRVIIQRCLEASVTASNLLVGQIGHGLMILVGFTAGDNIETINYLVKKIINLRIFDDSQGIMNKSLLDIDGSILSVSQFTLYADTSRGNRPSYILAMDSNKAKLLYDEFNKALRDKVKVETGIFGSDMQVSLINDGPVTITLER